jgi:PKD repeat protein
LLATKQSSQSAPSHRRAARALFAALVALASGCLWAPAALAQTPDFTWDPDPPVACELVTFTPSDAVNPLFDYENDDTFVSDLTHSFLTEGTHPVEMTSDNGSPVTHDVDVQNAPPVASFDYSPTQPNPGERVVFNSTSTDCGDPVTLEWDFDEDGLPDSTDVSPAHEFSTPGPHVVTLTASDGDVTDTDTQTVDVRDPSVPIAAFHRDPANSVVLQTGQEATFTSDSTAVPGSVLNWEIDGAPAGNDTSFKRAFSAAGWHVVRLTVTQPNGASDEAVSVFQVAAPAITPTTPTPSTTPAGPSLMKPFPIVRLVGVLTARGARITLLEVRNGPVGARVTVRCVGDDCPFKSRRRILENGRVRLSKIGVLAAGTRLQVLVREPGVIGRFVGFRIRNGKRPLRADRCLMPGASEPTRCT